MDVVMPQLGETVAEGTVAAWHKAIGDEVSAEEPLFEVETDKATTSIPAPAPGRLVEILVPAGSTVKVGTRLAVIQTGASGHAAGPVQPAAVPPSTARPTPEAPGA